MRVAVGVEPGPDDDGKNQRGQSGGLMHDQSSRVITHAQVAENAAIRQKSATPHPMGDRRIDDQRPYRHEPHHGRELHALGEGAGDQGRGDDGEGQLEHDPEELGQARGQGVRRLDRDAAEEQGVKAAHIGVEAFVGIGAEGDAVAFPEETFKNLFFDGFSTQRDLRISIRDKLILLLMHGGGVRESEAMSLWVSDIELDPLNSNAALVKIYNEEQGVAPYGWKSNRGGNSRKLFLKEKYGRVPRVSMFNTEHLGWKGGTIDHKDGYIIVNWFPSYYGEIFLRLWKIYHQYRASILCNHPYAFISFHKKHFGFPYTLNAFHQNYKNALKRINLLPSKHAGYDPHGHRHSYGRRLRRANINPLVIRRCMHHKSLESQTPYTEPNFNEISNTLTTATEALVKGETPLDLSWESLTKYGFNDIDPHQYFSGKNKKFKE